MHYQSNAFALPGTYTILSKTAPQVIQRNLLITDIDASEIQLLYKCSATTTAKPATTTAKPATTTAKPTTTPIPVTTTKPVTTPNPVTTTKPITTTTIGTTTKPISTTTGTTTKTITTIITTGTTSKPITTTTIKPVQWFEEIGNSWAKSCDFPGNDLSNVRLIPELCSFKCRTTLGCTHYYWAVDFCYLKSNLTITKANAVNNNNNQTLCGILQPGIPYRLRKILFFLILSSILMQVLSMLDPHCLL